MVSLRFEERLRHKSWYRNWCLSNGIEIPPDPRLQHAEEARVASAERRTDQVPPHAPQAEAALLGSLILRPEGLASAFLEPHDFHIERNRLVYLALCSLAAAKTAVDAVTLAEELERTGRLADAGDTPYLLELMQAVPHAENLGHYAGQVREASARRQMIARAAEAIRLAHGGAEAESLTAALDAAQAALASADGTALVRRIADVASEPLSWLWPGCIPAGKLTLLAGDPGLGKSFLTLDIAARVSAGRSWPDESRDERPESRDSSAASLESGDSTLHPPGDVILFGAEDDLADTVRPRLEAAGADLARIVAIEGVRTASGPRSFSLASDLPRLRTVLSTRPSARLVVIDPIAAFCGGVDTHKNADVRALLAPLAELASAYRVAVVAVTHLNKAAGGKAIYRAMGSLAYIAAARVGWLVVKDQADPARRLLLPLKNNLAEDAGGLAYRIVAGRLAWEEGPVEIDVDAALDGSREKAAAGDTRRHRADLWLEERLAAGPVPAGQVMEDAVGAGLTYKMVRDAKRRLGVRTERQGSDYLMQLDPDRGRSESQNGPRDLAGAADLFSDPFAGR